MPHPAPVPNRVTIILASASAVAAIAALSTVERLLGERSLAVSVPAMLAGAIVAAALVFGLARIILGPVLLVRQPVHPLSQAARLELVAGIAALFAISVLSRLWLGIDAKLSLALLYVPSAFVWLRREFARQEPAAGGT